MPVCRVSSKSITSVTRLTLLIALTFSSVVSSCQHGSYPVLTNVDSAEVWFDKIVNPISAAIVNGPEYRVTFQGLRSHPFYRSSESDRTYIRYDNDVYRNIDLLYDSYGDILVCKF